MRYTESKSYQYHQLTKHTLQSLLSTKHRLDWATQPDPFRIYDGAETLELPRQIQFDEIGMFELIERTHALQGLQKPEKSKPCTLESLSNLLFYSLAISAWKQIRGTDERWALRVNPSSGNLHPTECHLLVNGFDGIEDGAYHYRVKDHLLEKRAAGNVLARVWKHLSSEDDRPAPPAMLCLSSIFWREAWKYRDRAFRYCQLDLGHASAAACLAAGNLGWSTRVIAEFADETLAKFLGLQGSDEKLMVLIPLYSAGADRESSMSTPHSEVQSAFAGNPNQLSSSQVKYESIQEVYQATCLSEPEYQSRQESLNAPARRFIEPPDGAEKIDLKEVYYQPQEQAIAANVIRTRRSAVDMDGQLRISLARMSRIIIDSSRGFASSYSGVLPFQAAEFAQPFFIHIILYVHRVDGIASGVYYFDRAGLHLSCLNETNVQTYAKFASCLQDIASDGVFAVCLIADMQSAFEVFGERAYRYVHQEAGFIGHLFYLTAHALGIDATGIGCFIDDEINRSMPPGMEVVYNFTFGRATVDSRLSSLPAYDFINPSIPG